MNRSAVAVLFCLLFEWYVYSELGLTAGALALVPMLAALIFLHRARGIDEEGYFLVVKLPLEDAIASFADFMRGEGLVMIAGDSGAARRYDFFEVQDGLTVIQENTERFPLPPGRVSPFAEGSLAKLVAAMNSPVFALLSERGGRAVHCEPPLAPGDLPLPLEETSLSELLKHAGRRETIAFVPADLLSGP